MSSRLSVVFGISSTSTMSRNGRSVVPETDSTTGSRNSFGVYTHEVLAAAHCASLNGTPATARTTVLQTAGPVHDSIAGGGRYQTCPGMP